MRHIIRRMIIFPIMVIGSPMLYFLSWCYDGHANAVNFVKILLQETWDGGE